MKEVWSGSISFGLVNIPIRLYSAIKKHPVGFRLLDDKFHEPINYKRWCPKCKEEVAWRDVVKGVEIRKNEYYVFTKDEIEQLKPKKTDTIEIVEFVDAQIDPIYFDSHYYLAPEKAKAKAYFLLREVLLLSAKVAVGRFVMKEKEHVCVISSYKNGMLLTTLNYDYEIRDIGRIEELKEAPKLQKEEISLAKQIIDKMYEKKFDISEFKDTFADELIKALKKKEKGESVTVAPEEKKEKKEEDLVKALKESLKTKPVKQ